MELDKWKCYLVLLKFTDSDPGRPLCDVLSEVKPYLRTNIPSTELKLWRGFIDVPSRVKNPLLNQNQQFGIKVLAYMRLRKIPIEKKRYLHIFNHYFHKKSELSLGSITMCFETVPEEMWRSEFIGYLKVFLRKSFTDSTIRSWCSKCGVGFGSKKVFTRVEFFRVLTYANRKLEVGASYPSKKMWAKHLLGLEDFYEPDDIKDAWKKALLIWHPDKNKAKSTALLMTQLINEAYEILKGEGVAKKDLKALLT